MPARLARVAAFAAGVSAILATACLGSAYSDAKDSALTVGEELARFGDLTGSGYRVRLNGEPVNVASAMTDQSVSQVLDRFAAECDEAPGGLASEFEDLARALSDRPAVQRALRLPAAHGVVRQERDGKGMIGCFAPDDASRSLGLAGRVREFATTGDLGKFGSLRYVMAERGPAGNTHVVTAWGAGSLRVSRMFPREGDAPGSDADDSPRPRDARRLLTAGVEGTPYGVRIYDAKGPAARVLADYDDGMAAHGWAPNPAFTAEVKGGRAYSRPGVDLLVFADDGGGETIVSVVEMRAR